MTVKQKSLQYALRVLSKWMVFTGLCFSCIASQVVTSQVVMAQTVPKSLGEDAAGLRLLGSSLKDGSYVAGIDIQMMAGAHTYWKMPGDAGVPPVFAFNGSENVAKADVLFPAPARIKEEGIEAFGYTDHVVFPVNVTPTDATKPAILHADVTYAVCDKICIPAHGTATLTLAPKDPGARPDPVASWLAKVPRTIPATERSDLTIKPNIATQTSGDHQKQSWTLTWAGKTAIDDIFADAPEGFYFDTRKRGPDTWTLTAAQSVGQPQGKKVPVSLTLARKDGDSLAVTEKLDVAASTH